MLGSVSSVANRIQYDLKSCMFLEVLCFHVQVAPFSSLIKPALGYSLKENGYFMSLGVT